MENISVDKFTYAPSNILDDLYKEHDIIYPYEEFLKLPISEEYRKVQESKNNQTIEVKEEEIKEEKNTISSSEK